MIGKKKIENMNKTQLTSKENNCQCGNLDGAYEVHFLPSTPNKNQEPTEYFFPTFQQLNREVVTQFNWSTFDV